MLTFSSTHIKYIKIESPVRIARNCTQYVVSSEYGQIGKVSVGDDFGIIESQNNLIRIDRAKVFFKRKLYSLKNNENEHSLGSLEFLDTMDECILSLVEGSTYFFPRQHIT
jgi:hypothetical protein